MSLFFLEWSYFIVFASLLNNLTSISYSIYKSLRVAIFSLIAASYESKLVIIEAIVPVAKEKETTPKSINKIAKAFSSSE